MIPIDILITFFAASALLALSPGPDNIFVKKVEVNGEGIDRLYLTHDELMGGGVVDFYMGLTGEH